MDKLLSDLTDLHQHLGFSSTPYFLWELAHEQGIRIDKKSYNKFIESITVTKTTTQREYHHLFDVTQKIQSSPYAVERAFHNAISYTHRKANVGLIEIRFNPMRRNKAGEHDLDKIILSACIGLKKACLEYPVKAGIIIETDRRFSKKLNEILIEKAIDFKGMGVVGVDLSGPVNRAFKVTDLERSYKKARKAGLGLTFHSGETTDTSEMDEVIRRMNPQRIGHGVRAAYDQKMMKLLRDKKIVLEICPSSNIATKILKDLKDVKMVLEEFKKNKVAFTINSDCPTLININVRSEYKMLMDNGILSVEDVQNIKNIARAASFIN